jgi:hypothetical protein
MPTRIGLELDHDVNVALRPHVAGRRGAEQGQFFDPVATAHFRQRWSIDLFVAKLDYRVHVNRYYALYQVGSDFPERRILEPSAERPAEGASRVETAKRPMTQARDRLIAKGWCLCHLVSQSSA